MGKLISETVYQTISMVFPSAKRNDGKIRVSFALDVKDGVAVGMSGGGVWKGNEYIGSFYGLIGFCHSVVGENAEAVDSVLAELSSALESDYGVPAPVVGEDVPNPGEPELETLGGEAE